MIPTTATMVITTTTVFMIFKVSSSTRVWLNLGITSPSSRNVSPVFQENPCAGSCSTTLLSLSLTLRACLRLALVALMSSSMLKAPRRPRSGFPSPIMLTCCFMNVGFQFNLLLLLLHLLLHLLLLHLLHLLLHLHLLHLLLQILFQMLR